MKRILMFVVLCVLTFPALAAAEQIAVTPDESLNQLEEGLYAVRLEGPDWFDEFIDQGGASSDTQVIQFLAGKLLFGQSDIRMDPEFFGCSVFTVQSTKGQRFFGRNFDWYTSEAWIIEAHPEGSYASIATANMNFLGGNMTSMLPDSARTLAAYYAPLDGMNEKGLCVAVLYIEDRTNIDQQTDLPDITTTTAVRLLLNKAATVGEAVALLGQYDFHASMGMIVHLAVADAQGNMAAIEYVDHEMIVTESPVITNFYLAEGNKHGIGSEQSHIRFDTLTHTLAEHESMTAEAVRDALDSVSKHHFNDGETSEWSMVCDQTNKTVTYYHREDYTRGWTIKLD